MVGVHTPTFRRVGRRRAIRSARGIEMGWRGGVCGGWDGGS